MVQKYSKEIDIDGTAKDVTHTWIRAYDKDSDTIGELKTSWDTSGNIKTILNALNVKSDGTTSVKNQLILQANKGGTQTITVSSPSAWRTALSVPSTDLEDACFNKDTYNQSRMFVFGAKVNNSASARNGHKVDFHISEEGLSLYDEATAANVWSMWDSGWKTLTPSTGWTHYSSNPPMQYRKVWKSVEVRGIAKPTTTVNSGGTSTIAQLPSGYRPAKDIYSVHHGSGQTIWLLHITTGGDMKMERYQVGDTATACTKDNWLPFQTMFFIE